MITAVAPAGLVANLDVPASAAIGQNVLIRLSLKNVSSGPVSIHLGINKEIAFDPAITASNGKLIWNRLAGTTVAGEAEWIGIPPGESLTFDATWDLTAQDGSFVVPGVYTVTARLVGDGQQVISGITSQIRVTSNDGVE